MSVYFFYPGMVAMAGDHQRFHPLMAQLLKVQSRSTAPSQSVAALAGPKRAFHGGRDSQGYFVHRGNPFAKTCLLDFF